MRAAVLPALALWTGGALVLAELPWFRRRPLIDRIRPYLPAGQPPRRDHLSVDTFRAVIGPVALDLGRRASRLLGGADDLDRQLAMVGAATDSTGFRVRQLAWCMTAAGAGACLAAAASFSPALALLFVLGSPALAFLLVEDRLVRRCRDRRQRLQAELPVVAEQLGMLLSAGYSLGAALQRLAARSRGVSGSDLARVCTRTQHGLSEVDALREWAEAAGVPDLDHLVGVLALHRQGGDLSRLVSDEARNARAGAQQRTVAAIERRAQQVWIPVTVAALVPGVLFLAVPFIEAMRLFTAT